MSNVQPLARRFALSTTSPDRRTLNEEDVLAPHVREANDSLMRVSRERVAQVWSPGRLQNWR